MPSLNFRERESSIADDSTEACLVLPDSPKAAAVLGRRCRRHILVRSASASEQLVLSPQIEFVLQSSSLPSHFAESLDAVRNCGNFAAHPIKSTSSGEIVDVEPGEAEWCLDSIELLFDFYFVQPARTQTKRDALNAKLANAKRPPMK